jgi:hypothetical protein
MTDFREAAFFTSDFDFAGRPDKDCIIPYVTNFAVHNARDYAPLDSNRTYLAYYGGSGLQHAREALLKISADLVADDVLLVTSVNPHKNNEHMLNSKYCLVIRGDTSSTARLSNAVEFGCVPVIIADQFTMPFDSLINWSKLVIRFPEEAVYHSPEKLIESLREIDQSTYNEMASRVRILRNVFSYQLRRQYNPVTLGFIDILMKKVDFCSKVELLTGYQETTYCFHLYERFVDILNA